MKASKKSLAKRMMRYVDSLGEIVIFHDKSLDKLTNGSGKIEEKTLKQLSTQRMQNGTLPVLDGMLGFTRFGNHQEVIFGFCFFHKIKWTLILTLLGHKRRGGFRPDGIGKLKVNAMPSGCSWRCSR